MKKWIVYTLIGIVLSACNPARHIYFYEDKDSVTDSVYYPVKKTNYQIQPGDVLYFSIYSSLSDVEHVFYFSNQSANTVSGGTENMYLTQYVVSDSGTIRIPVIGSVFVAGSTINEVQLVIEKEARKYVSDAIVRVKMASFTVTFLGEFTRPGKITFYKDHVNLLDALGEAGEVTFGGNKENIRIMRQTPQGIYTYRINLNDKNLLTSNKFYLQPNDIVYAEPLPRKVLRTNITDYSMIISTISSTIAIVALFISLQNR